MKTVKKLFTIIFFLAFIIGCQQTPDLEKIKSQIKEINSAMTTSTLANDFESTLKFYANDAISMPSYEPMLQGMEEFKANLEKQKEMPMKMKEFSINTKDVWVSGNFVVEIGTYNLVMEMPADQGGDMPDKGKYLTLYEVQKDGSLLIKAETWNSDINPWEAMSKMEEPMDDKKM